MEPLATSGWGCIQLVRTLPPSRAGDCICTCSVDPHPDEAYRARPTSPQLRSGEVAHIELLPLPNGV